VEGHGEVFFAIGAVDLEIDGAGLGVFDGDEDWFPAAEAHGVAPADGDVADFLGECGGDEQEQEQGRK